MRKKEIIKISLTLILLSGTIIGTLLAQRVQNIQKRAQTASLPPCATVDEKDYASCSYLDKYTQELDEKTNTRGIGAKCLGIPLGETTSENLGLYLCCPEGYILSIGENNECVKFELNTPATGGGGSETGSPQSTTCSTVSSPECLGKKVDEDCGNEEDPKKCFGIESTLNGPKCTCREVSPTSTPTTGGGGGSRPASPSTPPGSGGGGCPSGGAACSGGGAWCAGPSRNYSGGCPPEYAMVENSWCSNGYCCCPPGGGSVGGGGTTQPTTPTRTTAPRPTPTATTRTTENKIAIIFRQQGITSTVRSGINAQLKTYITLKSGNENYKIEKVLPSVANGKWIISFSKDDAGRRIPAGVYSLSIKGNSHLRKKFENIEIGNGNVTIDKSTRDEEQLKAGDINNDNAITIEDQSIVRRFYTDFRVKVTASNSQMVNADVNKDGYITIDDLALIALNWSDITVPGDDE